MHILIIGARGMIGRKLAAELARTASLGGQKIERMTLADLTKPPVPAGNIGAIEAPSLSIAGQVSSCPACPPGEGK